MKKIIIAIVAILVIAAAIAAGLYFFYTSRKLPVFYFEGMKVETLKKGVGDVGAREGDTVAVHYLGLFSNGQKFDSSHGRQPYFFTLGDKSVIQGWELGVVGMKPGEARKLTIPPELAYGSGGFLTIPPNATLIFEIDLLAIMPPE